MNAGNQSAWHASEDRLDRPEGIWAFWHWNSLENSVWSMTAVIGGIAIFLTILLLIDWLIRQPAAVAAPGKKHESVEHVSLAMQSGSDEIEVQQVPDPIEPNYEPTLEPIPEDDEEDASPFWPGGTVFTEEPEKEDKKEEAFDPFKFPEDPAPVEEKLIPEPEPTEVLVPVPEVEAFPGWTTTEDVKAPAPVEIPLPEPEVPEFEKQPILPEFAVEEFAPVEVFPIIEPTPTPEPSISLGVTQTDWLPDSSLPSDGLLSVSANSKFTRIARPLQPAWGDIAWQKFIKRDFKAEDAAYAKSLEPVIEVVNSRVTASASTMIQKLAADLVITINQPKSSIHQGTIQTFEITLENKGNIETGRFILGARLPDILSHKFGKDVEQSVVSLAPGASITLPLIVRTDEAGIGKLEVFSISQGKRLSSTTSMISVNPAKNRSAAKPSGKPSTLQENSRPQCLCE